MKVKFVVLGEPQGKGRPRFSKVGNHVQTRDHEDYRNNRAVHAIANISRVYDERLQKHDFLSSASNERDGED